MIDGQLLSEAIKTVGVGKRGSKALSFQQVEALQRSLKSPHISQAALGAFIGALIIKGVSDEERLLEDGFEKGIFSNPLRLSQKLCHEAPEDIQRMCAALLKGATLDASEAERLGDFLMIDSPGDAARGLAASILRVRYETDIEYEGLLKSVAKTFHPVFTKEIPSGKALIQIAEPFDGTDHSHMITPLTTAFLQMQGYRVVSLCGRNSGPKFGNNLYDIVSRLPKISFLKSSEDLGTQCPPFGFYLDQKDLSSAMDRWVDIRRQTIKRPFMSTIERFVNPFRADICIASAFHPPYGEKMLTIAERAGFPKVIIIRNGIEGTTAFALKRSTKILCSRRNVDGDFERNMFEFDPDSFLEKDLPATEEILEQISPDLNAELIRRYDQTGSSGNRLFDLRVRVTCEGLRRALAWLEKGSCE